MKVEDCRVEQDMRIGDIEARLRSVEDAMLSININVEWMSKSARIIVAVLCASMGLDIGEMAGVIN